MSKTFIKSHDVLSQHDAATLCGLSVNDLAAYLSKRGYSSSSLKAYLRAARHFCYWIKTEFIPLCHVDETTVESFLDNHFKTCCCPIAKGSPIHFCRPALKHFLDVLRQHHLIALPKVPVSVSPVDNILQSFGSHMQKVHGSTLSTVHFYSRYIRGFLEAKYKDGPIDLQRLTAQDVKEYVAAQVGRYKPKTAKSLTTSLRVFFRFLKVTNQLKLSLEEAVPTLPHWKLSSIPKYLTEEQLQGLLSSFNLSTPHWTPRPGNDPVDGSNRTALKRSGSPSPEY